MKRKPVHLRSEFIVLNRHGQVFAGMKGGYFDWSDDWNQAKPLYRENTDRLFQEYGNLELIKAKEIL